MTVGIGRDRRSHRRSRASPTRAQFTARPSSRSTASYYGSVSMYGADPLGPPITVSVSGGGAAPQSASHVPGRRRRPVRADAPALPIVPGAVSDRDAARLVLAHASRSARISARRGGGQHEHPGGLGRDRARYRSTWTFQARAPRSAALYLGNAAYMLSQCSTSGARYAVTLPLFFGPADDASTRRRRARRRPGERRAAQRSGSLRLPRRRGDRRQRVPPGRALHDDRDDAVARDRERSRRHVHRRQRLLRRRGRAGLHPGQDRQRHHRSPRPARRPAGRRGPSWRTSRRTRAARRSPARRTRAAACAVHENRPSGTSPLPLYGTADGSGAFTLDVGRDPAS